MAHLAQADGQRIAVARNADVQQVAIGRRRLPWRWRGMRPWAELKPCAPLTKYVGVFEEQPMPLSLATMCGWVSSSHSARMMAAVMESCPQPAHSVDMDPS